MTYITLSFIAADNAIRNNENDQSFRRQFNKDSSNDFFSTDQTENSGETSIRASAAIDQVLARAGQPGAPGAPGQDGQPGAPGQPNIPGPAGLGVNGIPGGQVTEYLSCK